MRLRKGVIVPVIARRGGEDGFRRLPTDTVDAIAS
jgi:hypothetical protein